MTAQLPSKVYRIGSPENDEHHFTDQKEHADIAKKNGYEVSEYVLAAHEQEPFGYVHNWTPFHSEGPNGGHGGIFKEENRHYGRPLYTHPAPSIPAAVTEVDADDNFYSWFGREWYENYQQNQYTAAAKQMLGVMAESAWKASRRTSMLQSGTLTNEGTMQPIYEYYPDNGWSECNSKEHYEELTSMGHRTRIVYAAQKV